LTELATTYEEFWTGLSWVQNGGQWVQERNQFGFINPETGQLLRWYPEGGAFVGQSRAPFPYGTYPVVRPGLMQSMITTASFFDRRPLQLGFFRLVDDVHRQAAQLIPEEGVQLRLSGNKGVVWLMRGNPFTNRMGDPDDNAITRGLINLEIRGYVI